MGAKIRRQLFYANDTEYKPTIKVDINEYLIKHWPQLTLKQRQSVWTIAQSDAIDFEPIHEQIDEIVWELSEQDENLILPEEDGDDDQIEAGDVIEIDVLQHLEIEFPSLTEDQAQTIADYIVEDFYLGDFETAIYDEINDYVVDYAEYEDTSVDITDWLEDQEYDTEDEDEE